VRLFSPLVYGWCRRAGLQAEDAADVGQEVFRAVFRKVGDFRRGPEGGTFRAWLWTITRRKLLDFWEGRRDRPAALGGSDAVTRAEQVPFREPEPSGPDEEQGEVALLCRRAVTLLQAEFEEETWRAFWEVVVDGRDPREVAANLGKTPNAVYLAKSRVLRRLREEFDGLLD
jgi:RNA polymerase sigma-70 factor (ECF subfamily)